MSSDGENDKNKQLEEGDAKPEETNDALKKANAENKAEETKAVEKKEEEEDEEDDGEKESDGDEKDDKEADEKKIDGKKGDEKDEKKETKKTEKIEDEGSEEAADSEKDDKDSEAEAAPAKDKKKPQKNSNDDKDKDKDKDKDGKLDIPEGSGTELGEIPRIDASISRFKNDDLKLLHKLLFKAPGKTNQIKKNIRKFNGFEFDKDSDEYKKKLAAIEKFELKQLRIICEMLDLEKKGNKEDISERIIEFLIEPKDSGKGQGGGRPKRTAAVKANNRGYSSHDDSYSSDEKHAPRARRNAGKRANLKDDTSSGSDEEFHPSGGSEEERPKRKRRGGGRKKKDESEEESDVDSPTSEDSDDGPKSKKKKVANSSKAVKPKATPGRRGRKPAATTTPAKKKAATPAKRGKKKARESSDEEEESNNDARDEEGSSSEDEPLAKKTVKNPQPPTDEEIKTYVKEILEGANLEEITMKTVCKQVYAHYPDFDLTHKKDYIKTTVKSVIGL